MIFWNILGKNTFVFSSLITPVQGHIWSAAVSSEWQQHHVGARTTGKPKPPVRSVTGWGGSRGLCHHTALGPCYTSLLAQLAAKLLPRTLGLYDDKKLLLDFPLSWIYGALSWRISANWRFQLVVCSITKVVYLLLKGILSFRSYVWVKDKDVEGSFFGAIAGPLQVKLSHVSSSAPILSFLLFLYRPSKEKKNSLWIFSVRNKQAETVTSKSLWSVLW